MINNFVLGIFAILVLSGFAAAQSVAGAWRLDEIKTTGPEAKASKFSNPNIYLFTKGHWSIIRVEGDKPRSTDSWTTMTPEQVVDTYIKQFTASGGAYEVKGGTLTMKTTIAQEPRLYGTRALDLLHREGQRPDDDSHRRGHQRGAHKESPDHDADPPRITAAVFLFAVTVIANFDARDDSCFAKTQVIGIVINQGLRLIESFGLQAAY